jgi:lipoprotein-releasing system ATP-binding protein
MTRAKGQGDLLRVTNLTKEYLDGERTLTVLHGLELKVAAGDIVSITGASGSGKSTLLHLLGGLDRPTSGKVQFEGQELSQLPESKLSRLRANRIGIVFQFYHLLPEFTALENVIIPQLILGRSKREASDKAVSALEEVGLAERAGHYPAQLSGGEQQRVAVARALINKPVLLLADEPTGNLDQDTGEAVINLLWRCARERNCTMLVVTHEPIIADRADRHYQLSKGRLEKQ